MVYGESKVGKSTFAVTAPYPRLMLDVEGGHRFLPINVKYWDPLREEPPAADGTWDTCVVNVTDYDTVLKAYQWLQIGKHQFKSLIIDSVSELQVKCVDNIAGTKCRCSSGANFFVTWARCFAIFEISRCTPPTRLRQ
jgi:hypothetical protein